MFTARYCLNTNIILLSVSLENGRLISTRLGGKQPRGWACWAVLYVVVVVVVVVVVLVCHFLGTGFCFTSSSCVPGRITCAPSGDPLPVHHGRWFSTSAIALLPLHLGTSVTGKFRRIREFRFSLTALEP